MFPCIPVCMGMLLVATLLNIYLLFLYIPQDDFCNFPLYLYNFRSIKLKHEELHFSYTRGLYYTLFHSDNKVLLLKKISYMCRSSEPCSATDHFIRSWRITTSWTSRAKSYHRCANLQLVILMATSKSCFLMQKIKHYSCKKAENPLSFGFLFPSS